MNRTMITAVNTMGQLQKHVDVIGHNLANAETAGYKKRDASFSDMIAQQINNAADRDMNRRSQPGIRQAVGARISQNAMITTQGSLKTTDRPLDLAFTKENQYLKVLVQREGASEVQFTRNGELDFLRSGNGYVLATKDGHPVLDQNNQTIRVTSQVEQVKLMKPATFEVQTRNGASVQFQLGVIALNKPQFMEQKGDALIGLPEGAGDNINPNNVYTDLTGEERQDIGLQQGVLEASNVNIGNEMTDLMTAQRAIQFQSRSITMADQMMGLINGIR